LYTSKTLGAHSRATNTRLHTLPRSKCELEGVSNLSSAHHTLPPPSPEMRVGGGFPLSPLPTTPSLARNGFGAPWVPHPYLQGSHTLGYGYGVQRVRVRVTKKNPAGIPCPSLCVVHVNIRWLMVSVRGSSSVSRQSEHLSESVLPIL
jgi:hypothetical protein